MWSQSGLVNTKETNTSAVDFSFNSAHKPIEMYVFLDPLCPDCWEIEPYLRKLSIEYGRFFTIRPVLSGRNKALELYQLHVSRKIREIYHQSYQKIHRTSDIKAKRNHLIHTPDMISLAIKAAELQGKRAGRHFLRKIQEKLFLNWKDISHKSILIECANEAGIDLEEFKKDLYSYTAKKALQSDIKLTYEMNIDRLPAIVYINHQTDEQGIKISGLYSYDIYVQVLAEVMNTQPIPSEKPSLIQFIRYYKMISTKEIAIIYDWPLSKVKRELKKLQLKQLVEYIPGKKESFWKYVEQNHVK